MRLFPRRPALALILSAFALSPAVAQGVAYDVNETEQVWGSEVTLESGEVIMADGIARLITVERLSTPFVGDASEQEGAVRAVGLYCALDGREPPEDLSAPQFRPETAIWVFGGHCRAAGG